MYPWVPSIVLVRRGDVRSAVQAMKAGAADCLESPVDAKRLIAAIRSLSLDKPSGHPCPNGALTRTEKTVLCLVLEGRTSREIARMLHRSRRTIDVHRKNIMGKLGANSLADLVRKTHSRTAIFA